MLLHQNVEIFQKNIKRKEKATLGAVLDFAYLRSYLQKRKFLWKQGDAIFSEPEMLRSLLGHFWKVLIRIKQFKTLMTVSLAPKYQGPLNF